MATADETQPTPAGRVIELRAENRIGIAGEARSLIRISPEERKRRRSLAKEAVAAMRAVENGPDEDDREFLRDLDESRPGGMGLRRFYVDEPDPA